MVGRRDGQELGGTACHAYMEFECESLDITRLEKAVSLLLLRHPMLRARFFDDGTACIGEATQKTITIYRIEKAADQDSAIEAIRQKISHLRFDIERDDLIDIRLTIASPKRTIMHVNVDLLAADVLSIQILLEDLAYLYRGVDLAPMGQTSWSTREQLGPRRMSKRGIRNIGFIELTICPEVRLCRRKSLWAMLKKPCLPDWSIWSIPAPG